MKRFAGLVLCGLLGGAGPALAEGVAASAVVDWNQITVDAVTAGRPGPIGIVDIALVQIAVHDAVQAIEKRFEPYHFEIEACLGSRSAAVAAAAHGVLVGMYPAQAATLDPIYHSYLADKGLTGDPGVAVGEQAAAEILPLRRVNPNPLPPPFVGSDEIGVWRPTPSFLGNPPVPAPFSPMAAPWMGSFDPFTLTSPTRFRPEPPPALTSDALREGLQRGQSLRFAREHRAQRRADRPRVLLQREHTGAVEQRAARDRHALRAQDGRPGAAACAGEHGDCRRVDQQLGKQGALRPLAAGHGHRARRPTTAIRTRRRTPSWQPLINNPHYPDYTSGANNVAGAMTRTLQLFFDTDRVTFEVTSLVPEAVRKTRTYRRFSDCRGRHGRGTHAARHPLPVRGYRRTHARATRSGLDVQSLPVAVADVNGEPQVANVVEQPARQFQAMPADCFGGSSVGGQQSLALRPS